MEDGPVAASMAAGSDQRCFAGDTMVVAVAADNGAPDFVGKQALHLSVDKVACVVVESC